MTLRQYLHVARRWWWLVVLGSALAAAVAYIITSRMTPEYEARAELTISQTSGGQSLEEILAGQSLTKTYARIIVANKHLEQVVATRLKSLTAEQLEDKVHASALPETQIIQVFARDQNRERAAVIANSVADNFPEYLKDQEFGSGANVKVFATASPPEDPVSPNEPLNIALGAIIGLFVAVAAVALVEYLDDGVDEREDVEALGVPFLGSVLQATPPKGVDRHTWVPSIIESDPRSPLAESYRQVQANLAFALTATECQVLLVTSPGQGEGKSTTAANLAEALAESSKRVLLIDGDLRKPDAHRYFSLPNNSGLTSTFLVESQSVTAFVDRVNDTLAVMTGGPIAPNPTELLSSRRLKNTLDVLSEPYDVVVVDSPPILGLADASLWMTLVDGVLVVARRGKTRRGPLEETIALVRASRKPLVGVVLNGTARKKSALYDYRYGYDYAQEKRSDP